MPLLLRFIIRPPILITILILAVPFVANGQVFPASLHIGSRGSDVAALQQFLKDLGFFTHPYITGYFGSITQAAVESYLRSASTTSRSAINAEDQNSPNNLARIEVFFPLRYLDIGSRGSDVAALQQLLKILGFYQYPEVTGYFGTITARAVAAFQIAHAINPDGRVGPPTRASLRQLLRTGYQKTIAVEPLTEKIVTPPSQYDYPISTSTPDYRNTPSVTYTSYSQVISNREADAASPASQPEPDIHPPLITNISLGMSTTTSATITWSTDESSDAKVYYGLTDSYGYVASTPHLTSSHSITIQGLTASTTYHFLVVSSDIHGNTATSTDQTFSTLPFFHLSINPADAAIVSGASVELAASTTKVSLATVQFSVDGSVVGPLLTSTPFSLTWDSTAASEGKHTLQAVARDAEGRFATSTAEFLVHNLPEGFYTPFSAQSLWNSRPLNPAFGTGQIPAATNPSYINDTAYGATIFFAQPTDPSVTVYGASNPIGVWVADELVSRNVVIPRWPAGASPAPGTDGHMDIYDPVSGKLHSFFGLRLEYGFWWASKYTVTDTSGTGWGTPARPDGPRATGVPASGGILRAWELNQPDIHHALAIALDASALTPAPVFPATLADKGSPTSNTGVLPNAFPEGTLLMLPTSFDIDSLSSSHAKSIARALMNYGGWVVDRTYRSFVIIGEVGSGWSDAVSQSDLTTIRDALRSATTSTWIDTNGSEFTPTPWASMNLLSMRGPWDGYPSGAGFGSYNTVQNLFLIPAGTTPGTVRRILYTVDPSSSEPWFGWTSSHWYLDPTPNAQYTLSATGTGAVTAQLSVQSMDFSTTHFTSDTLAPGEEQVFTWPSATSTVTGIYITSTDGSEAAIRLELVATPE